MSLGNGQDLFDDSYLEVRQPVVGVCNSKSIARIKRT
jgi:hypothetical protein